MDFIETYEVGISVTRAAWMVGWIEETVKQGSTNMSDFKAVLGRLSFALGVLDYLKPFVSPLFSWCASVSHLGRVAIPWSVAFILSFVATELKKEGRTTLVRPRSLDLGPVFMADAKAEGMDVVLGGWECRNSCPPSSARWFQLRLTRKSAPWAFARGEPFRVIAALELYASLVALMLFGEDLGDDTTGMIRITGYTDNAGNTAALARLMSSKFPLVVLLTELAVQLRKRRVEMDLEWVPRNQNEAADAITNNNTSIFDPNRKMTVEVSTLRFEILPDMMQVADHLYAYVREKREKRTTVTPPATPATQVKKQRPLRERDPW